MKTDTGNKTWMGLVRHNVTRAAMLLVMMLTCLAAGANTVTLTSSTGQVTLNNGDVVTGTGGENTYLVISAGATVTLSGVDITNNTLDYGNEIPSGIACQGNATIILAKGTTNTIIGCYYLDPCIKVGPPKTTLTIKGYGTLYLRSWGWGACIGSRNQQACGNIVIEGGTLDLNTEMVYNGQTASSFAACIGSSGHGGSCGDITISGGNIRAESHIGAAAIGSGNEGTCGNINITGGTIYAFCYSTRGGAAIGGGLDGVCGNISISGITSVTAQKYSRRSPYCIGPGGGDNSTCGTLTLWGQASGYIVGPTGWNAEVLAPTNIPYTVSFNANGGTGSMSGQGFYSNTPQALRANTFTFGGKYFSHWSTLANGGGYDYTDGEVVTNLGNVTLYAQWHDYYTVHFVANGGTGKMNDQTITSYGQALTANAFIRTDYTFNGWNTKADGTGTSYADGEGVKDLGNITLYAQWHLATYTISFNANNGEGMMEDQVFHWNVSDDLTANTFTRTGYDFAGWNTKADGSGTEYTDGQTITNLEDMTLFAQWTPHNYSITYILDGGTNASSNPTTYTIEDETFTIAEPIRSGCNFVGWTYEGQSTPVKLITIAHGSTGDKTLVANWAIAPVVTLTQDVGYWELLDGQTLTGTGGPDTHITIADGATVTLSGVTINAIPDDISHMWAAITCEGNATIILNDGTTNTLVSSNQYPGIFVPEGKTLTIQGWGALTSSGKRGAAGIGASYSQNCGNIIITGGIITATSYAYGNAAGIGGGSDSDCGSIIITGGNITAWGGDYAAGIGSGYSNHCDCGDITITTGVTSVTVSESYQSASIGAGRSGRCGTVTIGGVVTGNIYGNFTYRPADNPACTITFDANGGTGSMDAQRVLGNMSFGLNDCAFTRKYYVFTGWNTETDGSGTAYTDGQTITLTDNLTLYAQWAIPVWVNNNLLSWDDLYDILGDGTMSFDPLTNTLTMDHPTQNVAIRTEGIDLTVKGFYKMTAEAGDVALDVVGGTLTLEGDFTLRGAVTGVQAGGDMNVKGQLRAYGTSGSGIHYTGTGNAWLTLQPGFIGTTRVEIRGGTDALSYTEGNVFRITTNGFELSEPVGGHVVSSPDIFYIWEGGVAAKRAVFTIAGTANGEGTAESPFQILSSDDWTRACADVANGCETAGLYFELNTNITATAMMGTPDNPFAGVIDGQRHYWKVTASINKDVEGAALFRTVSGATIKNFCVEGSVIGGAASGGIVGQAVDGTTTIENCIFNGIVTTTTDEPAENFVCGNVASEATVTYNNCLDVTNLLWPATDTRAYKVTGVDATLTLTGTTGIIWDKAIYAPEGATVAFTMSTLSGGEYVATGGTLTETDGTYSLVMPAQNVAMVPRYSLTYAITGNISTGGTVEINKTEAAESVPVYVTITPDPHYLRTELTVKDADDNVIPMTMYEEGFGYFIMPRGPVTVTVTFNKQYSFDATTGELRLLLGDFNNYGNNAFGTDVTGDRSAVLKVTAADGVRFTGVCSSMFLNFSNCTEIDLSKVNTAAMTHTTSMFSGCTSLSKLNIKGWNLQQVEYMVEMFKDCKSLREIDLSGINMNTSASMTEMFTCSGTNTGVCKLTLPAGMGVTASMYLNKGYYSGYYNGEYHNSGWQLLGNKSVVSGTDQYDGWTWATLPAQPTTATFVWSKMPEDFVLELPDGQDNSAVVEAWDGVTTNVKLTGRRLWKDGDWNTICLPFKFFNFEEFGSDVVIQRLDILDYFDNDGDWGGEDKDETNGYIYQTGFDETTGTLRLYFEDCYQTEAGTPYLIKWGNDTEHPYAESPTFTGVTIDKTMYPAVSQDGKVTFAGQYSTIVAEDDYKYIALGSGNTLGYVSKNGTLRPFRAHFEVPAGINVKAYNLSFGNEASSIENSKLINSKFKNNDDAWYDLSGRKLEGKPTKKGIYINNGRKVAIK